MLAGGHPRAYGHGDGAHRADLSDLGDWRALGDFVRALYRLLLQRENKN